MPNCRRLLEQMTARAEFLAVRNAGSRSDINSVIILMTTSNSMRVNAKHHRWNRAGGPAPVFDLVILRGIAISCWEMIISPSPISGRQRNLCAVAAFYYLLDRTSQICLEIVMRIPSSRSVQRRRLNICVSMPSGDGVEQKDQILLAD